MKSVYQFFPKSATGDIIPGATITVFDSDNATLSTLWADAAGTTPKTNPFITGPDGLARFYVDPAKYNIKIFDGVNNATIDDVPIGAAQNSLDATNVSQPIDSRLDLLESSDAGQDVIIAQNVADIATNAANIVVNAAGVAANAAAIAINESEITTYVSKVGSTSTGTQKGPRWESTDGQSSLTNAGVWDNGYRVFSPLNPSPHGVRTFILSLAGAVASVIRDTQGAVASVSRPAEGFITVTLTDPMDNVEYTIMATSKREAADSKDQSVCSVAKDTMPTVTEFTIACTQGSSLASDAERIYLSLWEA